MAKLEKKSRDALKVIYSRGVIRGRDLGRAANLNGADLKNTLATLAREKFVTVKSNANLSSEADAFDSYVAPLPSRKAEAEYEMNQPDPA